MHNRTEAYFSAIFPKVTQSPLNANTDHVPKNLPLEPGTELMVKV